MGRGLFAKLPTGKSAEEKAARDKLFQQFDPNGNGFLSLAEIDKGIQDVLGLEVVGARGALGAHATMAYLLSYAAGSVSLQASHHEGLPCCQGRVQGTASRPSACGLWCVVGRDWAWLRCGGGMVAGREERASRRLRVEERVSALAGERAAT